MQRRVQGRVGRGGLGGLLASTSVAALLIGGGAPPALASCQNTPGSNQASVSNSGAINCIKIDGITVTGDVTNTGTGTLTATSTSLQSNGIIVLNASVGGAVVNAGQITAAGYGNGIFVTNHATVSGGISNSGTITATFGNGVLIGSTSTISVTISSFGGGITNSGTITARTGTGIVVGDRSASNVTIKISSFAGGISNSGTIAASIDGIWVGGGYPVYANADGFVTISNFAGGISNSGTISAGLDGIFVGGAAARSGAAIFTTISTFSGGIANSGTIAAGNIGILVGGTANAGAIVTFSTFSGGISNSGTISPGNIGIYVNDVSTFLGGVSNSGTIAAAGAAISINDVAQFGSATSAGGGISNSGTISAGLGIYVNGVSTYWGGVSNTGTIAAGGIGIAVSNVTQFGGATSAGGGISNSGMISAGATGIKVSNISTFLGGLANSGTITGRTGVLIGADVTFAAGAAIVNTGTIAGAGGTAIDVSAATSPVTIDQNGGLISGAIKLSANADVLNISGGTINGNIVGQGSGDTINFSLGSGTFTYGSAYGFTGVNQVNVNSGAVVLNGANSATNVDVYGGTLSGSGSIDPTTLTIHSGGTFAPGSGVPGTSMTITGNLVLQSGALYLIYLNPTASTFAGVSGGAALAGTVNASFASGSYISKQYTILTAGSISGTFAALVNSNLPSNFHDTLGYDATHAYLDLALSFETPSATSLNPNRQNVANALIDYFNTTGGIPTKFATLSASALTLLDGEAATGAEQSAFQLTNEFLDLMLDPFVNGRGNLGGSGAGGGNGPALGFAPDRQASLPPDIALAYNEVFKAAPKVNFDQRWGAWGAAFGGGSTTSGDPSVGSHDIAAGTYGFAAGMDYHASPSTVLGFAMAGAGTNWRLSDGLGGGYSNALQVGTYGITWFGPAYLAGALSVANHWFTTNRAALGDQLAANFVGQSYGARLEGGYRVPVWLTFGVTPYGALQAQDFQTPSYSESDTTGGGFGLSYNAMNATDVRTELGARFDDATLLCGKPLILFGRLAWAHDFVSNPALSAAFETLPGSTFTVNGAPIPQNSALTTAGAQFFLASNWSVIAKFDGEFADGSQTYGGSGTLRYTW